jgi:plasmid maintenance system killer protein
MIRGFKDRVTEAVYQGESPKGLPASLVKVARRKLGYLDAAVDLGDLRSPPGNRLEVLSGIVMDNILSGSIINSGCASSGPGKDQKTWRLPTTTSFE